MGRYIRGHMIYLAVGMYTLASPGAQNTSIATKTTKNATSLTLLLSFCHLLIYISMVYISRHHINVTQKQSLPNLRITCEMSCYASLSNFKAFRLVVEDLLAKISLPISYCIMQKNVLVGTQLSSKMGVIIETFKFLKFEWP